MLKSRWFLAIPLVLAGWVGPAGAAVIRDEAHLFSADAIKRAEAQLDRIERETQIATAIETIESLEGQSIDDATLEHARRSRVQGLFILISKEPPKIEDRTLRRFERILPRNRLLAIRNAFVTEFKRKDFDAGLERGVSEIARQISEGRAEAARAGAVMPGRPRARGQGGFGIGTLLGIAVVIIGVLLVIRVLGSLFGGGYGYAGRPGMGGGYGPGYGGGGGGFLSSLFGGIGGALAGNWLYDQFSGRHHGGYVDNSSYDTGQDASAGNDYVGPDDGGADWGGGGGDGGGDWGGGGGGGDWGGGGGGDWGGGGGGGGDWGGGGGGGDW